MTYFPVISGPVAPYSNLPISPQSYQPSQFVITAITYGQTTTVTLDNGTNDVAPNYVVGQLVRLNIPEKYGARQINQKTGYVLSLPTTDSVEIGINSLGTDAFIASPTFVGQVTHTPPQIVAVGDINGSQINSSGRVNLNINILGSFINVSP